MNSKRPEAAADNAAIQRLLWVLAAATFVIFFQAFMVAPLISHLLEVFQASAQVTAGPCPPI